MDKAMYRLGIKGDVEVLSRLLETSCERRFWNKVQGYGLRESDFEKFKPDCSRRMFNHRKDEFLNSKFITHLRSKGKKSKYYSITPLGIAYFCQIQKKMDEHQFKKIFEQLRLFYKKYSEITQSSNLKLIKKTTEEIWKSLSGIIGVKELILSLTEVINCIKIDREEDTFEIKLSYPIVNDGTVNFRKFVYNKEQVQEFYHRPYMSGLYTITVRKIDDLSFFYYMSEFILIVLQYHIVKIILDRKRDSLNSPNEEISRNAEKQFKELKSFEPDILRWAKILSLQMQSLLETNNASMNEISTMIVSKSKALRDLLY